MLLGKSLALAVGASLAVGCSTGRDDVPHAICESGGVGNAYSSTATTVGEVRSFRAGPVVLGQRLPFAEKLPGSVASDPAAWCWVKAGDSYKVFAAAKGGSFLVGTIEGRSIKPSGAPHFP